MSLLSEYSVGCLLSSSLYFSSWIRCVFGKYCVARNGHGLNSIIKKDPWQRQFGNRWNYFVRRFDMLMAKSGI